MCRQPILLLWPSLVQVHALTVKYALQLPEYREFTWQFAHLSANSVNSKVSVWRSDTCNCIASDWQHSIQRRDHFIQ